MTKGFVLLALTLAVYAECAALTAPASGTLTAATTSDRNSATPSKDGNGHVAPVRAFHDDAEDEERVPPGLQSVVQGAQNRMEPLFRSESLIDLERGNQQLRSESINGLEEGNQQSALDKVEAWFESIRPTITPATQRAMAFVDQDAGFSRLYEGHVSPVDYLNALILKGRGISQSYTDFLMYLFYYISKFEAVAGFIRLLRGERLQDH